MSAESNNAGGRPLRPEIELLLCCARTELGAPTRERVETLIAAGIDWTYLVGIALAHRVVPLLYHTLRATAPPGVPGDLVDALAHYYDDNRDRIAHLVQTLLTIVSDLERESVPVIPLKGPTLGALAYRDPALRSAGDLDFMVHEAHLDKVCERLVAQGFRDPDESDAVLLLRPAVQAAYRASQCEYLFFRDRDNVTVEPHWALVPKTLAVDFDYDGLWERAENVPLGDARLLGLALEDLLLFLCVHGSKHQWTRLQWVCDIAELIGAHARLDWDVCLERSRHQGCLRMLLLGLALADRLLEARLPDNVARIVAADRDALALADLVRERMFLDENKTPPIVTLSGFRVRMRERLRDKLSYVARTITTPTLNHYAAVDIPDRLFFLYYPFKLLHDYVLLPGWIATRPFRERRSESRVTSGEAAEIKRAVRETWGARSEYWISWAKEQARSASRLNDLLLDSAGVAAGKNVLDLASGVGEPATAIVSRLAGDGLAVALDLVPEMVAATRQQAEAAWPGMLCCCAGDMEALPFADGSFDAVVCRLGIMFSPRPEVALVEARRVLRPGGRAAFLTWGPIDENPAFDAVHRAVGRYLGPTQDGAEMACFRFGASDHLAGLMRRAGFADVEDRELADEDIIPAERKFWRATLEMTYGLGFGDLPPSVRESLDRSLEDALAVYLEEDGYHIRTVMRLVAGRR